LRNRVDGETGCDVLGFSMVTESDTDFVGSIYCWFVTEDRKFDCCHNG
jgi:hypothetical protein